MKYFYDLALNEKLCAISVLVDCWEKGLKFTYNSKEKVFLPEDIGLKESFNISRFLYIMSNFIINKKSKNISNDLKDIIDSENVKQFLNYFDKNDFIKKLDILVIVFTFLSKDVTLKKLNFIDEIKPNYKFSDLAKDIEKYKLSL